VRSTGTSARGHTREAELVLECLPAELERGADEAVKLSVAPGHITRPGDEVVVTLTVRRR